MVTGGGDRRSATREFIGWLKHARVRAGNPSAEWIGRNSGIPASTVHDWTSSRGNRKRLPDWDKQVAPLLVSLRQYAEEKGRAPDRALGALKQWQRAYDDTQIRGNAICPLPDLDSGQERANLQVRDAGDATQEQQGWSLASDEERNRHWVPRSRGLNSPGDKGWRFQGREEVLSRIRDWLNPEHPATCPRVLVITGAPGAGKSTVLARLATTADQDFRASMPPGDTGIMAEVGSVSCAVHADGMTALEVAAAIATAAEIDAPGEPEDLALAISRTSAGPATDRFTVLIDAVDEAVSTSQARAIIDLVILPLAETCPGVRVIVGTRARDDDGDLIGRFGRALDLVDLDAPEYFREQDLADYALAYLQVRGSEGPYADDDVARPLAEAIAAAAGQNFLIAGLVARDHGLYDPEPADPARLEPVASVRAALGRYLKRLPSVAGLPARRPLTALAFAEASGLTAGLWKLAVEALPPGHVADRWPVEVRPEQLEAFARSSAANFLVETHCEAGTDGSGGRSYRLFHLALGEALLSEREETVDRADDEDVLARVFLRDGRNSGWDHAPAYLLRSLPGHAARAGLVDDLLADDDYLLHADLRRVVEVANLAESAAARDRARLLGHTPEAVTAGPSGRVAMFGVTEALDGLGAAYRDSPWPVPYRARWAAASPGYEDLTLRVPEVVRALCAVPVGDRALLAVGGVHGTVRLWDPADGTQVRVLEGHTGWVRAVCAMPVGSRTLLATGGYDKAVRLWDPSDGTQVRVLEGHTSEVTAVCTVPVGDRALLATGSHDKTVRLWDPADGTQVRVLEGHRHGVTAVCTVPVGDRALLATGSHEMVRLWDPADGTHVRTLQVHTGWVDAVCAVPVGDRTLLATGSDMGDGTVRLWDPADGTHVRTLQIHSSGATASCVVCAMPVGARTVLAVGRIDGTLQLWDPAGGIQVRVLEGHTGWVGAVCAVPVGSHTLLATGSTDRTVRLWDLRSAPSGGNLQADPGRVTAVCAVPVGNRTLLATAGYDEKVRLWDPAGGTQVRVLEGHSDGVTVVCAVPVGDRTLLTTAGYDETVRLWDPADGTQVRVLEGHTGWVGAVCAVPVGSHTLLATGSDRGNGRVRLWDPADGTQVSVLEAPCDGVTAVCTIQVGNRTLLAVSYYNGRMRLWDCADETLVSVMEGHRDGITAMCAVPVGDRTLLATAGYDETVRLWDPAAETCVVAVPVHHVALAVAPVTHSLAVGLDAGLLVLALEAHALAVVGHQLPA